MSTDVFNNFYNNPRKMAIYTNMVCHSASSENENTFSINGGNAQISNNNEVLTTLDLSNVTSTNICNWNSQIKTLKPKSITYITNDAKGESYKTLGFGKLLTTVFDYGEASLRFNLQFIKNDAIPCTEIIEVSGFSYDEIVNALKEKLMHTYIDVNIDNNRLIFTSSVAGKDFYIDNVFIRYSWETGDYDKIHYLEEDNNLYVPCHKYINGAFRGVIISPEYPKYNNDITNNMKSLKIAHIVDRVNIYEPTTQNGETLYSKHIFNVFGNLSLPEEYQSCVIFNDRKYDESDITDNWLNDDSYVIINNNMKIKKNHILGLYGYCNYVTFNDLWHNFGNLYSIIATDDQMNETSRNLIPSMVIYNPNEFEVKVNMLTWE